MPLNIPMPGSFANSFESGLNSGTNDMAKMMTTPAEMQLKQAEAMKANMMAQLLSKIMGGQGGASGANGANGAAGGGYLGIQPEELARSILGIGGEPPDVKRKKDQEAAVQTDEAKSNIKKSSDLQDAAFSAQRAKALYQQIKELLVKNPSLTGKIPGLASKFNMSDDPDLAAFQELTSQAQAELGKLGSARGGIGALKWASLGKPSNFKSGVFNMGMVDARLKNLDKEIEDIGQEHVRVTGKQLPMLANNQSESAQSTSQGSAPQTQMIPAGQGGQPQPQVKQKGGKVVLYKNGKEYHLPPNLMQEALTNGGFSLEP